MTVLAKHKVTGIISPVSEGVLKACKHLVEATPEEVKESQDAKHLKVFGYLPGESVPAQVPDMSWSKERLLALAANRKIEVDDTITKRELVAALTEGDK